MAFVSGKLAVGSQSPWGLNGAHRVAPSGEPGADATPAPEADAAPTGTGAPAVGTEPMLCAAA